MKCYQNYGHLDYTVFIVKNVEFCRKEKCMDNDVKLVLETDNTLIEFKVIGYKTKLAYCDTQNKVDYLTKTNKVECYYYFNGEGIGWGSVSDVYITTKDLELLSKGLSQILTDKTKELHFETEKRLFAVDVVVTNEKYNFCFKIIDGLEGIWVQTNFNNLDEEQFKEYIILFLEWSRRYPVLTEKQLLNVEKVSW